MCLICERAKPPRYYHCRKCKKCIFKMDHHCTWLGNCIGHFNAKIYIHLLVHLFINSFCSLLICIGHADLLFTVETNYFYLCIIIFPSLYTVYETQRLITDFFKGISKNQTLIESYKQVYGHKISKYHALQQYFGPFNLKWLLPTYIGRGQIDLH